MGKDRGVIPVKKSRLFANLNLWDWDVVYPMLICRLMSTNNVYGFRALNY